MNMESRPPLKLSAGQKLENVLRIATPIGAIFVFLVGLFQYRNTQEDDFRRSFWQNRYDAYKELVNSASGCVNAPDDTARIAAAAEFWTAYWGHITLVEDHHVYKAMREFGMTLDRAIFPDSVGILRHKAYSLGQACRTSLQETWAPVPLEAIRKMDE